MIVLIFQRGFWIICFIGLIFHASIITKQFFEYPITNSVQMDTPVTVSVPQLSVCFRYSDLLKLDELNSATGMQLEWTKPSKVKEVIRMVSLIHRNITLKQIFDFTPKADEVYATGLIRYPGTYDFNFITKKAVQRKFMSIKYYFQEFMCYQIIFKCDSNCEYNYKQVISSLRFSGMAFEFGFNLSFFAGTRSFLVAIHGDSDNTQSIHMAEQIKRKSRGNKRLDLFQLTYHTIETVRLPAPYASDCWTYSDPTNKWYDSQLDCISECLVKETTKVMKRFPFTTLIYETDAQDFNFKVFDTYQDLSLNQSANQTLTLLERKCFTACRRPDCITRLYITNLLGSSFSIGAIRFRINLANYPDISIVNQPMISFYDYLTLVLSCLGVWLGLSLHDFDPIKFVARLLFVGRQARHRRIQTETNSPWTTVTVHKIHFINQPLLNSIIKELAKANKDISAIQQTLESIR